MSYNYDLTRSHIHTCRLTMVKLPFERDPRPCLCCTASEWILWGEIPRSTSSSPTDITFCYRRTGVGVVFLSVSVTVLTTLPPPCVCMWLNWGPHIRNSLLFLRATIFPSIFFTLTHINRLCSYSSLWYLTTIPRLKDLWIQSSLCPSFSTPTSSTISFFLLLHPLSGL